MSTESIVLSNSLIVFYHIVTTKSAILSSATFNDEDNSVDNVNNFKGSLRYELLDSDISNVKKTWPEIYKKAAENGVLIMARAFKADPSIKTYFEDIVTQNGTKEEITKHPEYKCRLIDMMHVSNEVIQNIKNPEFLMPLLIKLGDYYKSIGVLRKHILVVQDATMDFFRNYLMFTKQILESWENFDEITLYLFLMILE